MATLLNVWIIVHSTLVEQAPVLLPCERCNHTESGIIESLIEYIGHEIAHSCIVVVLPWQGCLDKFSYELSPFALFSWLLIDVLPNDKDERLSFLVLCVLD